MTRYCYLFIFLLTAACTNVTAQSQLQFGLQSSNNYMLINTYDGRISANAHSLRFTYSGTTLNVPAWKISVKLLSTITDGTKIFPPGMLSFTPSYTSGQTTPGTIPNINQIGAPSQVSLSSVGNEVFMIPASNAPLSMQSQWNSYYDLQIYYNFIVAPGAYLGDLQGGNTQRRYPVALEFKAYDNTNKVLGVVQHYYTIDVFKLSGTPPVTNVLSLIINSNAKNALLEIKTTKDYTDGAAITYASGLQISSNTAYQVKVRSINAQFMGNNGTALPLNTVNIAATPINNTATSSEIGLSNTAQLILKGSSTNSNNINFDLKYFTKPNDTRLYRKTLSEYSTTLEYEITPQ